MKINSNTNESFVMIPNNAVQNIISGEHSKNSFIQLYGKKTIFYFRQLIELQNIKKHIYFSIDLILWMHKFEKSQMDRERKYLKEFLQELEKNSLIEFSDIIDFKKISSNNFMIGKLNIYEYDNKNKDDVDDLKVKNYFMLMDSEYSKIMNEYNGNLDQYNLLNLFCNIKSRIKRNAINSHIMDKVPEVAYPGYGTIKKDIFIESDKTLKQYIDTLVELDLIRFGYAGDMKLKTAEQTICRKSNFTYVLLSNINWKTDLETALTEYRNKKRNDGWTFISKQDEISANDKRSITQKINTLNKMKDANKTLTQSQLKELVKLERQQEKWKREYEKSNNTRKLEEDKLKADNPNKPLWEIYRDMNYMSKAIRALKDEGWTEEDIEVFGLLDIKDEDDWEEDESKDKGLVNYNNIVSGIHRPIK